jgi:hypothetical protein
LKNTNLNIKNKTTKFLEGTIEDYVHNLRTGKDSVEQRKQYKLMLDFIKIKIAHDKIPSGK